MIQVKCIQKFRDDKGRIYGYRLIDLCGKTQDITPENLKAAISNKLITVVNLTLTTDGRLISTKEKGIQNCKNNNNNNNNNNRNKTNESKTNNYIIINKHQPLLYRQLVEKLPSSEILNFRLVKSLSNFEDKAKLLNMNIIKLTASILAVCDTNRITIVSEVPVRILADRYSTFEAKFSLIDFKNADLSHITSISNIVDVNNVKDAMNTNFDLKCIQQINASIVSKYRYNTVDLLDDKDADRYLDIAYILCRLFNWLNPYDHPASGVYDHFIDGVIGASIYNTRTELDSLRNCDLRDLLLYNWSHFENKNRAEMDYYFDLAAWALSRMISSHDFTKYFKDIVGNYELEIFALLNEENLRIALNDDNFKNEFYFDTYDEGIQVIKNAVIEYKAINLLNDIDTVINCFNVLGDKKAAIIYTESHKFLKRILEDIDKDIDNNIEILEKNVHKLNKLLQETFGVDIINQSKPVRGECIEYTALTSELFKVDETVKKLINGSTDEYTEHQADIGAPVRVLVNISMRFDGTYDEEYTYIQLVSDKLESSDNSTINECNNGCKINIEDYNETEVMSGLDFDDIDGSIDYFKNEYYSFLNIVNKNRDIAIIQ